MNKILALIQAMPRLTKSDIETLLLRGQVVQWLDDKSKQTTLQLKTSVQRRLLSFLLTSEVREAKGLPTSFIGGLHAAFEEGDDPADSVPDLVVASDISNWRLEAIETEGFGGLNTWKGSKFNFDIESESWLIEGANGSGKSSLVGAILWCLLGERPRDQDAGKAEEPRPVYAPDESTVGNWPPVASYPMKAEDIKEPPVVRVLLRFKDQNGKVAKIQRLLKDGEVIVTKDPNFQIPTVFLETGLHMPTRIGTLRLDDSGGQLAVAVQRLTGLDDFAAIGDLAAGLCNGGREYLSGKKKDLESANRLFLQELSEARNALETVAVEVPAFEANQTSLPDSQFAVLLKSIEDRSADLAAVVSSDVSQELQMRSSEAQNRVIAAITTAMEDLEEGLDGVEAWQLLKSLCVELPDERRSVLRAVVQESAAALDEAEQLARQQESDSKFQLKAVAAHWHGANEGGSVMECPLCEQELKNRPSLAAELAAIQSLGEVATRSFEHNVSVIVERLDNALPSQLRQNRYEVLLKDPRKALIESIRQRFVSGNRYSGILTTFAKIIMEGLNFAPLDEPQKLGAPRMLSSETASGKLKAIERCIEIAEWFGKISTDWLTWWAALKGQDTNYWSRNKCESREAYLAQHLNKLSEALAKAEPYRKAAKSLREAWQKGVAAAECERDYKQREKITETIRPLKELRSLAEATARDAIGTLSGRIESILEHTLLSENLKFSRAKLAKKTGLVVMGSFTPELHLDATLVANTSWLRIVLWAFTFAMREEATEQYGNDPLSLFVFDDPQSTFDGTHRNRWARYVANLQERESPAPIQIILVTHDEVFRDMIKTLGGMSGRDAMIACANADRGCAAIFEGASLERRWAEAKRANTHEAALIYMQRVRAYVEGLLRVMLRGEAPEAKSASKGLVIGASRQKIIELHNARHPPWDRSAFKTLVSALEPGNPAIAAIEMANHQPGTNLGIDEARTVEKHWRETLSPSLDRAFRLSREFFSLHGQLNALHAAEPTAVLPDGHTKWLKGTSLALIGRAAALSHVVADGRVELEFTSSDGRKVVLHSHSAYRLLAPTLEPVARRGDILITREKQEPLPKSLVIALSDEKILARRFDLASNHSDIAVLSAQAINPSSIAEPVIAHKASLRLHKVVGVLFENGSWNGDLTPEMEVAACNESELRCLKQSLGLVEVVGHSAVPRALDKQYLITGLEVDIHSGLDSLIGKPVIAVDSNDDRYIKRLQMPKGGNIVLESLDIGGDFEPIVLSPPGKKGVSLTKLWPVVGVLFELP